MSGTVSSNAPGGAVHKWFLAFLFVVVLLVAAALRLADLANRPMHCDEANQALKFGRLLERGQYAYDPDEHHGPTLYYFTLPIAGLAGTENLTEVGETHLRLLPAIFGIILISLVWLIRDELGRPAAFWAAVLAAVSPAMVFYSRYYIQEMLLVCFTFGAMVSLWRYAREVRADLAEEAETRGQPWLRKGFWLASLGLCIGLMHASKETCVIALFAMALAAGLTIRELRQIGLKRLGIAGLVVFVSAAVVSVLFFSSFFSNWQGVVDSMTTYGHYFHKGLGEGVTGPHEYPWYHYFRILFWWQSGDGPVWTELLIGVLALLGLVAAATARGLTADGVPLFRQKQSAQASQEHCSQASSGTPAVVLAMARFIGIYTLTMAVVYSVLAYKTPWCVLGMLHGMILLAGIGAAVLVRILPGYVLKTVATIVLIAAAVHLAWGGYRASFVAYADPDNPYVYSHTTADVPALVERLRQVAAAHPDGRAMPIQVICPSGDYWPLPWYLRDFTRTGWLGKFPPGRAAPLIVTEPSCESGLAHFLFVQQPPGERFMYFRLLPEQDNRGWQIHPNAFLQVYVHPDLWEAYQAAMSEQDPPAENRPPVL